MRLKSIELVGFKSFVDRTVIQFEPGITGVVGPNGSGKSNIVDAIRWVMGEQSAKHLRGGEMQDVIFAGSERRASIGMASVFLSFDNSDGRAPAEYANYAEITVGRRLYRSGESEYFVNKTPCRLKDIVDLFLGTGTGTKAYSIVEQGRIGQIVTAKPEERRLLIEEAAGISKFRNRRDLALRRMEATRANLLRLHDIVGELEKQLDSLQRQAKKAERYRALTDQLKQIELTVAAAEWQQQSQEHALALAQLEQFTVNEASALATVQVIEAEMDAERLRLTEIEQQLTAVQERVYALQNQMHLLEAKGEHKTQEIRDTTARIGMATTEIDELTTRRVLWNEALDLANATKVESDLAVATAQEEAAQFEATAQQSRETQTVRNQRLRELETQSRQSAGVCIGKQARVEQLTQRQERLREQIVQVEAEREQQALAVQRIEEELAQLRTTVQQQEQQVLSMTTERESLEQTTVQQRAEHDNLEHALEQRRMQLQQAVSRLESLEEVARNFEGYAEGVRALMQARRDGAAETAGVRGVLAEYVRVPGELEIAMAAVCGDELQAVLVGDFQDANTLIQFLQTAQAGRGVFVPAAVHAPTATTPLMPQSGLRGQLVDLIQIDPTVQSQLTTLLGNILVVDTLSIAQACQQQIGGDWTYVTTTGEVLESTGVVRGGSTGQQGETILARARECEGLRVQRQQLQVEVDSQSELKRRLQERLSSLQQRVQQLSQDRHGQELQLVRQREELVRRESEIVRLQDARSKASGVLEQYRQELTGCDTDIATTTTELGTAQEQQQQIDRQLATLRQEEETARVHVEQALEELSRRRTNLAAQEERARGAEREIGRLLTAMTDAQNQIERKQADIASGQAHVEAATTEREQLQTALTDAVRAAEIAATEHQATQRKYQSLVEAGQARELRIRELRKGTDDVVAAKHNAQLTVTQIVERLRFVEREIVEKYHLTMDVVAAQYHNPALDLTSASSDVQELRQKIERMGGVNTDAIAEYEELTQRYDFLKQQAQDLEASLESLQRAIHKINRVSRERFRETFGTINERFKQVFPKMFHGGEAELQLTNDEDLLEAGVEIIARPPGKKLQNLTLLSGGEKALTAVSLIFAMFLVRPSPFCLLDEVDAPLDEANVDRFNDMVREMTQYAQFILITHNKRTMELTDSLYGVTMQEPGVSRIVSVKLKDVDTVAA